jgi:small-conductance mechanosensitive channel
MGTITFKDIINWYWFLISRRKLDFLIFILIIFILPILPYAIVSFKLISETDEHLRTFYGDGSIMILCSGILCSFVSMLFEHRTETEKKINLLINLVLIIFFVIITFIFVDCQLTYLRNWRFISCIIIITSVIYLMTILAALYLNFRLKINYSEVQKFVEEIRRERIDIKAAKSKKSKGGTRV